MNTMNTKYVIVYIYIYIFMGFILFTLYVSGFVSDIGAIVKMPTS